MFWFYICLYLYYFKLCFLDIYLKIRWHSLVQAYQRDNNFKYAKQMRFVPRIKTVPTKVENWPEFIITEEDLKEDRNVEQDQEEFVFLEAEEEEHKAKETKSQEDKEKVKDCIEKTKLKDVVLKENLNNKMESNGEYIKQKSTIVVDNETNVTENDQKMSNNKTEESATSKVEQKMAAVDVNKNNEEIVESVKECKPLAVDKPQPTVSERCEDVIFGELVSAMLKRMDENKKKNIKKEIMNLLFS